MKTLSFDPSAGAAPVRPSFASLLLHGLYNAVGGVVREIRIRRDTRHLESLSDNILSDIGISRGQITNALRQGRIGPAEPRVTAPGPRDSAAPRPRNGVERGDTCNIVRFIRPDEAKLPQLRAADNASASVSTRR